MRRNSFIAVFVVVFIVISNIQRSMRNEWFVWDLSKLKCNSKASYKPGNRQITKKLFSRRQPSERWTQFYLDFELINNTNI